jgi:DNA-binding NtrC family response regulator
MKLAKHMRSEDAVVEHENANSEASVLRLRLLIEELINEVNSLDERTLGFSETLLLLDKRDRVNFYEEVARFEAALIRRALRRTNGHQVDAARLLSMNPSTLNAKIKQYKI